MGRSLGSIIVLAPLALLGACGQVGPRAPFHASAEREIRYAAEATLAVKENRRDEVSEATANGRVVLPQMPEIWASSPADEVRERAAEDGQLAQLDAGGPPLGAGLAGSAAIGCAGVWWDGRTVGCPSRSPGAGRELPPLFPAAITPTGAPETGAEATSPPAQPTWPMP